MPQNCPCSGKISTWVTHLVCEACLCLGLAQAQVALKSTDKYIKCTGLPHKLLRHRLAQQTSLSGGVPVLGGVATPEAWQRLFPSLQLFTPPPQKQDDVCEELPWVSCKF